MSKITAIKVVKQTKQVNQASVIFFHGSGDTGNGVLDWIKFLIGDIELPHIKFLFPTAPLQPYTPMQGEASYVWFDRKEITPFVPEDKGSLDSITKEVKRLISQEIESGVPANKIIIGGFSMGGALAMHAAYRVVPGLAGVFALSSFLNKDSLVYSTLKANPGLASVPLYMCHGDRDSMVPQAWGRETFDTLSGLGVKGQFHSIKNCMHELKKHELLNLIEWIKKTLPEETIRGEGLVP